MVTSPDESPPDLYDDRCEATARPFRNPRARQHPLIRFNSLVLDVDSTLSGIEGIDWLASLRGPQVEASIASLTDRAMEGAVPLEAVYADRLRAVRPTLGEIEELASAYVAKIAPHSRETLALLKSRKVSIALVSGGLREAILPLAREVGLEENQVHAVSVFFDDRGNFAGFEEASVLTRQNGKRRAVREMALEGPTLAVGDGITDCEIRPVVDAFAAYTGFVRRAAVIKQADHVIEDFHQLEELVLG